ncbi:MAG TPA: hypothetical protein VHO47_05465 [Candidatus Babeliales bacterium]|nr:hypothetical protein [Candidatus Babeliales bacterium]
MKHKLILAFIFISSALCAMDNQKTVSKQLLWFIESILQNSKSDLDSKKAFDDLQKSALSSKYKIIDKNSLKILRTYELLGHDEDAISEPIRSIVKENFLKENNKK